MSTRLFRSHGADASQRTNERARVLRQSPLFALAVTSGPAARAKALRRLAQQGAAGSEEGAEDGADGGEGEGGEGAGGAAAGGEARRPPRLLSGVAPPTEGMHHGACLNAQPPSLLPSV